MKNHPENEERKTNEHYDLGYKMGMAEFKGRTLQSLEYIEIKLEKTDKKVEKLSTQITNIKLVSTVMGAVAAIITTIINPFKIK